MPSIQPPTAAETVTSDGATADFLKLFTRAVKLRSNWEDLYQEIYDYALPQRESFNFQTRGERKTDKIFDSTAVVSAQEFASRMQSNLVPPFARWAELEAGAQLKFDADDKVKVERALDDVTDFVFDIIQNNSNFDQEVAETLQDLAVGTGCLLTQEGDVFQPVKFTAVSLPQVYLLPGPFDEVGGVFRVRSVRVADLKDHWPEADFDAKSLKKIQEAKDEEVWTVEGTIRDYSVRAIETHNFRVVIKDWNKTIQQGKFEGFGSNPWATPRWSTAAGELYGRGPLVNALPDIKVANLVVELTLENAEMAITGMYQSDDMSVINPDNFTFEAGTIFYKMPGTEGLSPLIPPGNFDVAQLVLNDMRGNIKKALFDEQLGPIDGAIRSATEIVERQADFSRRVGAAFGRLQAELVHPVIRRTIHILKKKGLIEIPQVDGREIRIQAQSPLGNAQQQQEILNIDRWMEMMQVRMGPQITQLMVKQEETAAKLADLFGVPSDLVRDDSERAKIVQEIASAAGQATQAGADPNDLANGLNQAIAPSGGGVVQ